MIKIVEDQVTPFLNSMVSRIRNPKPLMDRLADDLYNAVKENITTEGVSLLGHKWTALKPATIKSKQRRKRL